MTREKITFSQESLRLMDCEEGKSRTIFYDKKQPKLACIVSPAGTKTFALHTFDRLRKKPLQRTIGRFPEISINKAREIASQLLAKLAEGQDIAEAARAVRAEPTVDDIFQNWLIHAKSRVRTWKDSERRYRIHISPTFGKKKISTVNVNNVRIWHSNLLKISRQRKVAGNKSTLTKATANRCLSLLRAIFNSEASHLDNPCQKVKPYHEESRDRFLQPDELKRFFTALEDESTPQEIRDFVIVLLFTGARRSNVMSMKWGEIDFSSAVWRIPAEKSKNMGNMNIPLVPQVIDTLRRRKQYACSIFVFPGNGKTGHLVEPKRAWSTLVKRSGLKNLRIHDLRRTCGSYQAASGSNQAIIGKSLGHKSISTTSIYTRLNLDPVRASMERAANSMLSTASLQDKVIKIKRANSDE